MMRRLLYAVLLLLLAGGCVKPIAKLGCCLKENITDGCVLYNTTTYMEEDYTAHTVTDSCDNPDMNTTGHCNVSFDGGATYRLVPICTQDVKVPCIDPGCTAMVCGDFAFKPRVAPGVTSTEDAASESTPANLDDEEAALFYKAQCRFLPMDADLRHIMKSSKSSINVFRVGVGESFNEFDQYRYYFPMSDQFCSPVTLAGQGGTVDRYMNYIDPVSLEPYYPLDEDDGITENCFDDQTSSSVYPPFTESDDPIATSSGAKGTVTNVVGPDFPVVPDTHNYRFAHRQTRVCPSKYVDSHGGYYQYKNCYWMPESLHKDIDRPFYSRELSTAHVRTIYDLDGVGSTRAPFECELGSGDCLSGNCDTTLYNRGSLVEFLADPELAGTERDIVADCVKTKDQNENERVICSPIMNVTEESDGEPPFRDYASVHAKFTHIEMTGSYATQFKHDTIVKQTGEEAGPGSFKWYRVNFDGYLDDIHGFSSGTRTKVMSREYDLVNVPSGMGFYWTKKRYCTLEYGEFDEDDEEGDKEAPCSYVISLGPTETSMGTGPHAGGIVFFGKTGEAGDFIQDEDSTKAVIGYAIVDPDEFDETMLAKGCNLWEGSDYKVVDVASPLTWDGWTGTGGLGPQFMPLFDELMESYSTYGFKDGCGGRINAYDSAIASMPWVVAFEKGQTHPHMLSKPSYTDFVEQPFIASTPAYMTHQRNIYDEHMWDILDTSSCSLRRNNDYVGGLVTIPQYYNVLYTEKIILLLYEPGSGSIGNCAIDEATYLPKTKTYGWCEPCTASTLAYQQISANDRVYMPAGTADIQEEQYTYEEICEVDYTWSWTGSIHIWDEKDNVSCMHPHISDIDDYQGSIGNVGSPRTVPEASFMKKRLGEYMKTGIMPVIDMRDDSNWDLENPDYEDIEGIFELFYDESPQFYSQYDFQRLFGEMGALVVIVDDVSESDAMNKTEKIMRRASKVRQKCFGCLVAFHVNSPPDNESFRNTINTVMQGPGAAFTIDLITFDYPVHAHTAASADGAEAVMKDIASYGNTALRYKNKPVMVVGFNVKEDAYWDESNYGELFDAVLLGQGELVRNGVIGIVYAPVRTPLDDEGIVNDAATWGKKTPKFCELQKSMQKMTATVPTSVFSRVNALEDAECVLCGVWDTLPGGVCDPTEYGGCLQASDCPAGQVCQAFECVTPEVCPIPPGCDPYFSELHGTTVTNTGCPTVCLGTGDCSKPIDYPDGCADPTCNGGCTVPPGCGDIVDCTISEEEAAEMDQYPWHMCDDGTYCTLPAGYTSAKSYKCQEGIVTENCTLCNETSGSYQCTYNYANGTIKMMPSPQPINNITSDIYMDILAGFPRPTKCCLYDEMSDTKYSFTKRTFNTAVNKPIVFPKSGGNVDCGIGADTQALGEVSTFCSLQPPPMQDFDITCDIS